MKYIIGPVSELKQNKRSNNTRGVIPLPTYGTDPINQRKRMRGKMNFGAFYGKGESPREDGLFNIRVPDGISRSNGPGLNEQYNYGEGCDGDWNNNCGWPGGNRTGE